MNTKELREKLKVSTYEFAPMIGITRQSLWNKEQGISAWTLPELIRMTEIMQHNGSEYDLMVSHSGDLYIVCIKQLNEE